MHNSSPEFGLFKAKAEAEQCWIYKLSTFISIWICFPDWQCLSEDVPENFLLLPSLRCGRTISSFTKVSLNTVIVVQTFQVFLAWSASHIDRSRLGRQSWGQTVQHVWLLTTNEAQAKRLRQQNSYVCVKEVTNRRKTGRWSGISWVIVKWYVGDWVFSD